jgi:hypothetical protein
MERSKRSEERVVYPLLWWSLVFCVSSSLLGTIFPD